MSPTSLADLHARAQELGIPRYRMLERDELQEAIERAAAEDSAKNATGDAPDETADETAVGDEEREERPRRSRRRGRRGRGRGRGRAAEPAADKPDSEDAEPAAAEEGEEGEDERRADIDEVETEEVSGVLDRMPQGYGFLRLGGLRPGEGDVYISASQIKRCELRPGDEVVGPAREPRRGERHRALVRVDSVNGQEPEHDRVQFEDLTPIAPHRRIALGGADQDPLVRAVDLLAPLALGQRVLVLAQPRSGRTTLLRAIGRALADAGAHLVVLLADERPEEVTAWEQALPEAEIVAAPADQEPREQVRAAELAAGHARRRAEAGDDVAILIDSLSRLALGYRDPARVKRLFGAGRELAEEGSGSLTVVATVLEGDERADEVRSALETNENVLLTLDAGLAAAGVVPSLVVAESSVSGEEELRSPEELERVRAVRTELSAMEPEEAARELGERIAGSSSNDELLQGG
jgi:transcription termination factor Rho